MPRPGFVLDVDRSTPPILTWHGEGFRLERLPAGRSRVVYAPDCTLGLPDGNWTESCVVKASPNPSPSKAEIDLAVNPLDPNASVWP